MATPTEYSQWMPPPIPESIVPEEAFDVGEPGTVGLIEFARGQVEINAGREAKEMVLVNTGDRPIQIGAHYHLSEANKAMAFDREAAFGFRLDIPSGSAIRFEPGQSRKVKLTRFAGAQVSLGMNDITNGSMRSEATMRQAMRRLREQGYCFEEDTADNRRRADKLHEREAEPGKSSRAKKSPAKPARTRRKSP